VFLAKVRGTVVATAKRPGLTGRTLVLLERLTAVGEEAETGRSRQDMAVVGIVDYAVQGGQRLEDV